MRRFLRRWLAPIVLLLCGGFSLAYAADPDAGGAGVSAGSRPTTLTLGAPADAPDKPEKTPTLAYFMAVAAVVVVLCILCVPSRKAESSTARR